MKVTDDNKAFFDGVYSVVMQIPAGHVTTYGHVAYLLNRPQNARMVGSALKHSRYVIDQLGQLFDEPLAYSSGLPWQRVVGAGGKISPRTDSNGAVEQASRLREEGVAVANDRINLDEYGWFPDDVDY
ncbi:hypothetical protein DICA3_F17854 [Diutina catenulata]